MTPPIEARSMASSSATAASRLRAGPRRKWERMFKPCNLRRFAGASAACFRTGARATQRAPPVSYGPSWAASSPFWARSRSDGHEIALTAVVAVRDDERAHAALRGARSRFDPRVAGDGIDDHAFAV